MTTARREENGKLVGTVVVIAGVGAARATMTTVAVHTTTAYAPNKTVAAQRHGP